LRTLDSGSAQSQITIGDLNQIIILNPKIEIQQKFEININDIDSNINNNKKNNKKLEELKQILLSKLATIKE
jgi:restriction endonuclease S subunit